jgi:hypothetical protein
LEGGQAVDFGLEGKRAEQRRGRRILRVEEAPAKRLQAAGRRRPTLHPAVWVQRRRVSRAGEEVWHR